MSQPPRKNGIIADLHLHSHYSDGLLSPAAVVAAAAEAGLSVVSVTDHACVDGLREAALAANEHGVFVIPGVELNSRGGDFLGYFIDDQNARLGTFLDDINDRRVHRMQQTLHRVQEKGYAVEWETLLAFSRPSLPMRTHLARFLVEKGQFPDVETVFRDLLGRGRPAYVPADAPTEAACIRAVAGAGGVTVLAHPQYHPDFLDRPDPERIRRYCKKLSDLGVVGIETINDENPRHTALNQAFAAGAREYGLLNLSGSNFHGVGVTPGRPGDVGIDEKTLSRLESRLPENCIHPGLRKRARWRRENLTPREYEDSLTPTPVFPEDLSGRHLVEFTPDLPPMPAGFTGVPFILLAPGGLPGVDVVRSVLSAEGISLLSERASDIYPRIAWTLYNMYQLPTRIKHRELLRFTLDRHLYGDAADRCIILFFDAPPELNFRKLKQQIRRRLGRARFYKIAYGGIADVHFTSFLHMPDPASIDAECWKLVCLLGIEIPRIESPATTFAR